MMMIMMMMMMKEKTKWGRTRNDDDDETAEDFLENDKWSYEVIVRIVCGSIAHQSYIPNNRGNDYRVDNPRMRNDHVNNECK